jgi:hypothetical protein
MTINSFEDGTLYIIKRKESVKYSVSMGDFLVLDKSHAMYYGGVLKDLLEFLLIDTGVQIYRFSLF